MNFMWYSSGCVPYHFCYMDTICNPYKYDRCIKSIWASYGNATGDVSQILRSDRVSKASSHLDVVQNCMQCNVCAIYAVGGDHGSPSGPAYLYSNGGPGVPYALPNGIALYCTTDGSSYLVPTAQQQVSVMLCGLSKLCMR